MNNFKEQAEATIRAREESLKEAIKIKEQLDKLPTLLTEHDWGDNLTPFIWGLGNRLILSLFQMYPNQEETKAIKDFLGRELGFAFEKVRLLFDSPNFVYEGKILFNGVNVEISLKNTPRPEGCTLIRKTEMKEVEFFEAICEETGLEV